MTSQEYLERNNPSFSKLNPCLSAGPTKGRFKAIPYPFNFAFLIQNDSNCIYLDYLIVYPQHFIANIIFSTNPKAKNRNEGHINFLHFKPIKILIFISLASLILPLILTFNWQKIFTFYPSCASEDDNCAQLF